MDGCPARAFDGRFEDFPSLGRRSIVEAVVIREVIDDVDLLGAGGSG